MGHFVKFRRRNRLPSFPRVLEMGSLKEVPGTLIRFKTSRLFCTSDNWCVVLHPEEGVIGLP